MDDGSLDRFNFSSFGEQLETTAKTYFWVFVFVLFLLAFGIGVAFYRILKTRIRILNLPNSTTTSTCAPVYIEHTITYNTAGSYTYTVPLYTTSIVVEAVGGGEKGFTGGDGADGQSPVAGKGGGGGASGINGSYVLANPEFTIGDTWTITMGAGGTSGDGDNGEDSEIQNGDAVVLVSASGGSSSTQVAATDGTLNDPGTGGDSDGNDGTDGFLSTGGSGGATKSLTKTGFTSYGAGGAGGDGGDGGNSGGGAGESGEAGSNGGDGVIIMKIYRTIPGGTAFEDDLVN